MRLTLVDNLVMPEEGDLALLDVHPHLGLLALAASAERDGHSMRIYDPKRLLRNGTLRYDDTLYERAAADILAQRPEAVGFTTLGCSFLFAINVAALLRRHEPDLPILLGGPHATMLDQPILERFPQFDLVVRHEADEIFPAVLDALPMRDFNKVPGLSWRDNRSGAYKMSPGKPKVEDLDSLALLNYDHYPIAELGLELLRIEAGRGCPFMCTFCSTAGFFQRSFRLKSADRLVLELERLRERYGFSEFKLDHDMFTVNKRKVLEFCEAVRGRGFRWRVSARVDCVNAMMLERMADAGCIGLYFGIETGSQRMQKISMKRLDLDLVEPTLAICADLGIDTTASFITGYPEEERADQDDTLDMIGRCFSVNCLTQLHILQPEPGTPMYAERGADVRYDGYASPYNSYLLGDTDRDLVLGTPEIFQTYFHYPAALPREAHLFAVQAVDLLRRVGPDVLRYALRAFDGRLAAFVDAFHGYATRAVPQRSPGWMPPAELLAEFVASHFGAQHPLHSLFRLGLTLHDSRALTVEAASTEIDWAQPHVLSDRVRILSDLHDCEHWLQIIRDELAQAPSATSISATAVSATSASATSASATSAALDADDAPRYVYMLHLGRRPPEAYRIDEGVEAILSVFVQPQRCDAVAAAIRDQAEGAEIGAEFFHSLIRSGILVPVAPASIRASRAKRKRASVERNAVDTNAAEAVESMATSAMSA